MKFLIFIVILLLTQVMADKPNQSPSWRLGDSCSSSRDSCCCKDAVTVLTTTTSTKTKGRITMTRSTTFVTVTITRKAKGKTQYGQWWADDDGKPDGFEWGDSDPPGFFNGWKDWFDRDRRSDPFTTPVQPKRKRQPNCPPCPAGVTLKPGNGNANRCCNAPTTTTSTTTASTTTTTTSTQTITRTKVVRVTVTASVNSTRHRERDEVDEEYRAFLARQVKPNDRIAKRSMDQARVAIVTFMTQASKDAYHEVSDYKALYPLTTATMKEYANKFGYQFLLQTSTPLEDAGKQAYWRKMDLILDAFAQGYDYVLYTDIDVMFLDMERSLESFLVDKDIITVNECGQDHVTTLQTPRSGFMLFKNSPLSIQFLQVWKDSFSFYETVENPEQSALEALVATPAWRDHVHLHSWTNFHSYDTCNAGPAFSMHFPGKDKVARIARAWLRLEKDDLKDYAAGLLRKSLLNYYQPAIKAQLVQEQEMTLVRDCLSKVRDQGYQMQPYDLVQHSYVKYYLESSHVTNIPWHIWLLDDEFAQEWSRLNPGFKVHVLSQPLEWIKLLMPDVASKYDTMTTSQQQDYIQTIVLTYLGGYFVQGNVKPVKSIQEWGAHTDDSLVLSVNDGSFGRQVIAAAAFQPVIINTFSRMANPGDQDVFTNAVAGYICYSFARMSYTPKDYAKGGHAPGMHVFENMDTFGVLETLGAPKLTLQG